MTQPGAVIPLSNRPGEALVLPPPEPAVVGYRIRNWKKFQHYKRRSPPWIKLHRELLDNREWAGLSDAAGRLLVELWLLASQADDDGQLPADPAEIAWRLRRASEPLATCLQELVKAKFLMEIRANASTTLATRSSRVETEQSRAEGTCEQCGKKLSVNGAGRIKPCPCTQRGRR